MIYTRPTFSWRSLITGSKEIIKRERFPEIPTTLSTKFRAWRHGFLSSTWALYGLDEVTARDYLPDFAHLILERRLNKDMEVLQNKILFRAVFGGILNIPENICLLNEGRLMLLPDGARRGITSFEALLDWCRADEGMFWKPRSGMGGQGAFDIRPDTDRKFRVNGEIRDSSFLIELSRSRRDFLVCPVVIQAHYSKTIFPGSINTVRVRTLIDPETNKAFVASAYHRFGGIRSAPVDNLSSGGLAAVIDVATGILGRAATKPVNGKIPYFDSHPDTGAPITGVQIPNWETTLLKLQAATEAYDGICSCGWDVVIQDDGFTVLEGNNLPQTYGPQLAGGMLRNERVRNFFVHHRIISG